MPELAEVAYYARQWDAGLHERILRVHVNATARIFRGGDARALATALTKTEYLKSRTHGKNMLFSFSGGVWLGGHLGMTGEMLCEPPDYKPLKHDHLVLFTADAALVYRDPRQFGHWRLERGKEPPAWWRALPVEIMAKEFTAAHVAGILKRHGRAPLKAVLLDQARFPGIGNWMADEVLWQMRLHPAILSGKADAAVLRRTLQSITKTSLRTVGRDWSDPPKSWLFAYRWKAGGKCPRCGAALERGDLRGRTACWCPKCQPSL